MTVTPTRREQVTFSNPVIAPIEEWVVSQHSLPTFNRITQLSGRRVWVRASSSYYESLRQLNWLFRELGLPPIYIETVPEYLQDGDLLEMVAAGIIPLTVTDSFKGRIWLGMISGLRAHKLIPLRDNGRSARPCATTVPSCSRRSTAIWPMLASGPFTATWLCAVCWRATTR